jgi:hypothetical protein
MKNLKPFRTVYFIEVLFDMPWKSILILLGCAFIAAICDFVASIIFNEKIMFEYFNGIFKTLNTSSFLLWIFAITLIVYFFINILCSYKINQNQAIGRKTKMLLKFSGSTGFLLIEVFYLIGTFCIATIFLALIILDLRSVVAFLMFSFIFLGIAIGTHWIYLSAQLNRNYMQ